MHICSQSMLEKKINVEIKPVSEAQSPSYIPPVKMGATNGTFAFRLFYWSLYHSKDLSY